MSTVRGYSSKKQAHRDAMRRKRTSHIEPMERMANAKPLSDEIALARLAHTLTSDPHEQDAIMAYALRLCSANEPEPHLAGEFPMSCYRCHMHADS